MFLAFGGRSFPAKAEEVNPPNNKFGIHLAVASEEDLQDAANLVNSSGGDWGWATLVIEEKDRQQEKWQRVFDQMRELHLIPIVRLATSFENGSWRRPDPSEAKEWAVFLDSLNWVIKKRYIVLFNEPNRADEWGGKVDPENYGQIAFEFAKKLKEKNPDFFLMLSGFDAASPHELPNYEDEEVFLRRMVNSLPGGGSTLFEYLDGWASHSYPNHGFVGSPWGEGRNSVKSYLWELNLLKRLGIKKDLPVFVTETGWPHMEGKIPQRTFYSESEVAENLHFYFNRLFDDPKVWAITPFILNYQDEPFDHFSWRRPGSDRQFYPQYQKVCDLAKIKGEPQQEQKLEISTNLPQKLITGSTYQIPITVKNEGQAIWSRQDGYELKLVSGKDEVFEYLFSDFYRLKPFEEQTIWFYLKTGERLGKFDLNLVVAKDGESISNGRPWTLEIIPAFDIDFRVSLFPKIKTKGDDFKFIIYNEKEEPVFEKTQIKVSSDLGKIEEVKNLAIGQKYRLVILKPYYLPRQEFLIVDQEKNEVRFERMLPLDFDQDGRLSFNDLFALLKKPKLFRLFWPN